jgi:hypothetical protein
MPKKPPVKRPGVKPVPLGTPPAKPEGRRPAPSRLITKATVKKTPMPKITKKPSKPVTERQLLDVKNMTPAEKIAYLKRGKRGF